MKISLKTILAVLAIFYLGILSSGCQSTVSVRPGDVTIRPGESVKVIVTSVEGALPKTVWIKSKKPGIAAWSSPVVMSHIGRQYTYTFEKVEKEFEYVIDIKAEGVGPYEVKIRAIENVEYKKGLNLAREYQNGTIKDYRIVIKLHSLSPPGQEEFLRGFMSAYVEANKSALGEKYVGILRASLAGDQYDQAFEQGKKHVNNQVTDTQIQTLIRRSLGISGSVALGWKAGYIEGFNQEKLQKALSEKPKIKHKEKNYYQQAQAMYDALRAATGL